MGKIKKYENYKNTDIKWITEIPEHWNTKKIRNILKLLKRPVLQDYEVVTCFRDGQVTLRKNRRESGFTNSLKEIGYQGIVKGDLVVHGMDGFAGAIGISENTGKGSPVLNVLASKDISLFNLKFVKYYLKMMSIQNVFLALSTGIRERSCDLGWKKLSLLPAIIPSIEEQEQIVKFIEYKEKQINQIIQKQKKLIKLLEEKKKVIITEAVTKGLDKNATMKDSGVDYIGQIPQHWEVRKLKFISKCNEKTLSENDNPNRIIKYIDISSVTYKDGIINVQEMLFENSPSRARRIVRNNDTIISTVRTYLKAIAKINRIFDEYICSTGFAVLTPKKIINPTYMFYALRSDKFIFEVERQSVGISYPAISSTNLINIRIQLPSTKEQNIICDFISQKINKTDSMIDNKIKLIEKLEEYKKTLIASAVTGQIDVRDYIIPANIKEDIEIEYSEMSDEEMNFESEVEYANN